ncbi:MAG: class I SAM-dependent methyltransferase [Bacteroidetes bacterium]|nr:class I SAM-dependent methyltransferase [Bacteroidota bacterium]
MPGINEVLVSRNIYSETDFNGLYPLSVRELDRYHWTSLSLAKKAAGFLVPDGRVKVLDIGSGAGKFCLAAACYYPDALYYGVEQRRWLRDHAEAARIRLGLENVRFIHGNFTQLDLRNFDSFYFYNSFYENLSGINKIDDSIEYSVELYNYYSRYLFRQLRQKPRGTRLCTLCSSEDEVPPDYHVVGTDMDDLLKFWIKV